MSTSARHPFFALVLASLVLGCSPPPDSDKDRPPAGGAPKAAPIVAATRVEAAVVQPSQTALRLVRPGEIEPSREADVAAALGGFVEYVAVDVGDRVKSGSLIAKVDTRMQVAQRELAEVEVAEARRELTRLQSLGSSVAKSRSDTARTRLERARAQFDIAEIRATRSIVRAPFSGVISHVAAEKGEVAAPGAPIARVVQLEPAVVSVAVADRDVAGLAIDDVAIVTTDTKAHPLRGKIKRIEPTADLKTRAFRVEVEIDEGADTLRPGMIASVEFRGDGTAERIVLPQDLIVTKLDANGVFIVDDDSIARWRPLKLGAIIGEQVVVEEGLEPGARVISTGQRGLSDGDPLIVTRQGRCCVAGRIVYGDPGPVARNDAETKQPEAPAAETSTEPGEEPSK